MKSPLATTCGKWRFVMSKHSGSTSQATKRKSVPNICVKTWAAVAIPSKQLSKMMSLPETGEASARGWDISCVAVEGGCQQWQQGRVTHPPQKVGPRVVPICHWRSNQMARRWRPSGRRARLRMPCRLRRGPISIAIWRRPCLVLTGIRLRPVLAKLGLAPSFAGTFLRSVFSVLLDFLVEEDASRDMHSLKTSKSFIKRLAAASKDWPTSHCGGQLPTDSDEELPKLFGLLRSRSNQSGQPINIGVDCLLTPKFQQNEAPTDGS